MQHPDITHINRTGYPPGMEEPKLVFTDSLGYEIYEHDEFYSLNDELFLEETLGYESIKILELLGATKMIAKK